MEDPSRTRWTSAPVSIMVPTCGCSTARTPCSDARRRCGRGCPAVVFQPSSSRSGRLSYPSSPDTADSTRVLGAGGVVAGEDPVDLGKRVVTGLMHEHRGEAADRGQVVAVEHLGHLLRVGRQEPVRAELGRGEADVLHLGEHPFRGELVAPVRDLTDSPGDGRAGDPVLGARGRGSTRGGMGPVMTVGPRRSAPGGAVAGTGWRPRR